MIHGMPFLFGKMPAVGDFVGRGLREEQRLSWDQRCSASMVASRRTLGSQFDDVFEVTRPYGFFIEPSHADPWWQFGWIAPSCDRTGRLYPLVVGLASSRTAGIPADALAHGLASVIQAAVAESLPPDLVIERIAAVSSLKQSVSAGSSLLRPWRKDWMMLAEIPQHEWKAVRCL